MENYKRIKCLPDWVLELSSRQSKILINNINSCPITLLNQVQQIYLNAGSAINIIDNKLVIADQNPIINHFLKEDIMYEYNGPVFCVEVNTGIFYTRRNGIPVWTGNSRATGPRQRLTRQPPEGPVAVIYDVNDSV